MSENITANSSSPPLTAHHYRPDIDGLRAVAVSLVLGFHAFPENIPGGFVGVDIFFIISGYLISKIILVDLIQGKFRFDDFYVRRIRRIFPALMLVLVCCYLFGWFVLLPDEYEQLGKHIAGGAGFMANFVLLTESGYFDNAADLKPLLHLWSLGIEEQFYFVWPLLLYFVWKRRFNPLWIVLLVLALSFLLNVHKVHEEAVETFYLPFTRFWELMIGCLLAYTSLLGAPLIKRHSDAVSITELEAVLRNSAAFIGCFMIVLAVVLLNKEREFPGWWALLPTLGAFLLIAAGPLAWLNRSFLAHPGMVFVGLISFPLYLWHWPLLSFLRIIEIEPATPAQRIAALALSFLLAWLTYRFVEKPIRLRGKGDRKTIVLCSIMGLVAIIGLTTSKAHGLKFRMREKAEFAEFFGNNNYGKTHNLTKHDRHVCNFYDIPTKKVKESIDSSCFVPHSDKSVFLWGDSHAQHLNYGLVNSLPADVSLLQVGASGCPPSSVNLDHDPRMVCNKTNRFALSRIEALKPDVVILAQYRNHERNDYNTLIVRLKSLGVKHIVLVGPVPQWHAFLYKLILKKYWANVPVRMNAHLDETVLHTDNLLSQKYARSGDVTYISLVDRLCDKDGCLTHLNGNITEGLITYDYGHFTLVASDYVVKTFLAPTLMSML